MAVDFASPKEVFCVSIPFPFIFSYSFNTKPHIAYLLYLYMDSSVTYIYIVRGRKIPRPRQPVPSTLLVLNSAPGGLIRTNKLL
jgi:hypothetical protein